MNWKDNLKLLLILLIVSAVVIWVYDTGPSHNNRHGRGPAVVEKLPTQADLNPTPEQMEYLKEQIKKNNAENIRLIDEMLELIKDIEVLNRNKGE